MAKKRLYTEAHAATYAIISPIVIFIASGSILWALAAFAGVIVLSIVVFAAQGSPSGAAITTASASPKIRNMQVRAALPSIREAVASEAATHSDTLWARRYQLVTTNAYGDELTDKWAQECREFVTRAAQLHCGSTLYQASLSPSLLDPEWRDVCARLNVKTLVEAHMGDRPKLGATDAEVTSMTGVEYEIFVGQLVERAGWSVRTTAASGDQGIDLIAVRGGMSIGIQCKRYSGSISNKAVQEVIAGIGFYGLKAGVVVTNSAFTASAQALASSSGITLLHHSQLSGYLGREAVQGA